MLVEKLIKFEYSMSKVRYFIIFQNIYKIFLHKSLFFEKNILWKLQSFHLNNMNSATIVKVL
jgi:hypothetical protein